jgi:HAD superfamily hydrolase (TIGR01509 family)
VTLLFIFDMDDVLYDYDYVGRMAGLTGLTGLSFAELRERWWHDTGETAAEAGAFATSDDYLDAFTAALGTTVSEADWVRIRGSAMTPLPDSISAVVRAKELGQVTLLTNNGPVTAKHLSTLAPALAPIFGDHLFTSSDYGARKPDPLVFEAVLSRYGIPAERAFFADDLEVNVAGARSVGITAHRYVDAGGMLAAIEAFAASTRDETGVPE